MVDQASLYAMLIREVKIDYVIHVENQAKENVNVPIGHTLKNL